MMPLLKKKSRGRMGRALVYSKWLDSARKYTAFARERILRRKPVSKPEYNQKRHFPRARARIEIAVYNKKTSEQVGRLVDISTEGIMLAGGLRMDVDTIYEFRIKLPVSIYGKHTISFDALCIWSNRDNASSDFRAGFQIIDPTPDLKELLDLMMHSPEFEAPE